MGCAGFSIREDVYMGENDHAVFCEMHVCLQSMSAGLNSVFKGPDRIFGIVGCVASMRNRLRHIPIICGSAFRCERC